MNISFEVINTKPTVIFQFGDPYSFAKSSDCVFQVLPNILVLIDKSTGFRFSVDINEDSINIKGTTFVGDTKELRSLLLDQVFTIAPLGIVTEKGFEIAESIGDINTNRNDHRDVYVIADQEMHFYIGGMRMFTYAKKDDSIITEQSTNPE